jgi:hypothetical protein
MVMSARTVLMWLALVVGVVLIGVSIEYFLEPARSLPSFFPGHHPHSGHHHKKDAIAALVLGLAFLAVAWSQSGSRSRPAL